MTTPRQVKTNQVNARASTGPRTKAGKARAANNARRHGLSVAIACDAALAEETEALARRVAGDDPAPEALALARAFAEAQIDLLRVRKVRRHLLARLVEETHDVDHGRDRAVEVEQSELMRQLRRLECYERRALARRRRATAAFDPSLVQAVRRWA